MDNLNPNPHPNSTAIDINTNKAKRQKLTDHRHHQDDQSLIPGLPDHIAQLCLSLVQPSVLYSVCHSWRRLIYSQFYPPFLSLYTVLSSTDPDHHCRSNSIQFYTFDPISSTWHPLPSPPQEPPLCLLVCHPSFISRHLPIQTVSGSGHLILLAATTHNFSPALTRPLIFNPLSRTWTCGPPLVTPRRWCVAGTTQGAVYVASGIGSQYSSDVAKSVERWELENKRIISINHNINSNHYYFTRRNDDRAWKWEKVKGLRDGRFSRDAIDAIGYRGKLCMVNMKGDAAKEGIIYDVENDEWKNMPPGMVAGWKGPVATMEEEVMYVVYEAKGALRRYDPKTDNWEDIIESDNRLRGAQQIAAGGGRVCVICSGGGGGSGITVVDVVASPVRLWVVETPPGFEAMAVHILPRMTRPDS